MNGPDPEVEDEPEDGMKEAALPIGCGFRKVGGGSGREGESLRTNFLRMGPLARNLA